MKFKMKDVVASGKVDPKKLAALFRAMADSVENGGAVATSLDSGESHIAGSEWYKVSLKS